MSNYHYSKAGGLKKKDGSDIRIPKFSRTVSITTDDLVREMHHHCSLSESELKSVLMVLADALPCLLSKGDSVTLDEIGTFSPTLQMKDVDDIETLNEEGELVKHNARHIEFGRVNFRPSPRLIERCRSLCKPEHDRYVEDDLADDASSTLDERIALIKAFIAENGILHVKDYMQLTGLRQTSARQELNRLCSIQHRLLIKTGAGTHKYYLLRAAENA